MRVGCPKEIKNHEYRVGLTPGSVREYIAHGHEVIVETKAGAGIGADDDAYRAAGARIVPMAKDVFEKSDMVVKVKEPQPSEWAQLREGQILYTYLHLAPDPEQTRGLLNSGVTAIAYETVTDERGGLPLLAPMSEVAGRLSIQAGATSLQKANGGRGVLLGGVPGVLPAKVTIIGGGVVGLHAAKMAVGLGADVSILDRSIPRLRQLDDIFNGRIHTRYSTIDALEEEVFSADLVVGAVLIPGAAAPKLVTREMLSGMKKGAVVVDVAIDQGGCFETSHATTHSEPTYEVDGIVHYCVANMPGAVPITSAQALNNATLHYGLQLADRGLKAIAEDRHLRAGLNVHRGRVTNAAVAEALGYDAFAPEAVLNVA
ncbi:alanine dehydrogenase [Sinorhizobium alkalisoli]|uniref:Alanine dehydrogenase n=1 Tax=Sinorhizobium alkalisoli TaxID=1752398 RepID=A0A1E3VGD1_9HYPH|nr:alanine dehydrogenase [Sinorhizobium alkalisoli]MCA1493914.1 alanine dehydrogenase [Ensifer sp. NBAIM29]MCG5478271.1 alanine dehydrogenase [Sinorhizobium alkalisoli]ODR92639.1 alanine dehydrogenase [Sinorhizobium alkalisoli]QFI66293.1 Alanine dehydrogenase [Sinorhizobium alkalisoli]